MEKPKVFANPIKKKLNNSQELYYSFNRNEKEIYNNSTEDITKKINNIFKSSNHVYKSKVLITTNNGDLTCDIVGQNGNSLLTLDGKTIKINDILDIKKI